MVADRRATGIVIVEDDERTGPSLSRIMTGAGYDGWEAPSVADANGGNGAPDNGRAREMSALGYPLVMPVTTDEILITLSSALKRRRLERMSRYSMTLAHAVGYPNHSINRVRLASVLHDFGNVGDPDAILLKPGPLSPDECKVVQCHAHIGYRLLAGSASGLLGAAATVALGHHEWWDGSGHPRGLSRDQIPELARIAAVTAVFDALTSDSVYRAALPVASAVAIMTERRGRQFEPRLLDAFVAALDEIVAVRHAYGEDDETGARVPFVDEDDVPFDDRVALSQLLDRIKPAHSRAGADLGPRELEVLGLVAAGLPNKAIAERLYISVNTVRNHVKSILQKLEAHSKLQAVAVAVRQGLIDHGRFMPAAAPPYLDISARSQVSKGGA
jgi:DNA-binding CsgD family transcriptional regulator